MKRELGSLATHRAFLGLAPKSGAVAPFVMAPTKVFRTQVAGLVRRLRAIGCKSVVIGISGGLDSTLVLLVAAAAFDKLGLARKSIHAYSMPGFGTSKRTKGNAEKLCEGLGVDFETIPIAKAVRQHFRDIGHDGKTTDVTYENAQARMRTMILMDKANMLGAIVLGTGDMSEIALGWSTYNGDHMSMFGVNAGVPKTVVRKVCSWWADGRLSGLNNPGRAVAPRPPMAIAAEAVKDIVATPVSPELKKGQVTENTIGPYELHDFFLWNFIMNEMGPKALAKSAAAYFKNYNAETIEKTLAIFLKRIFTQSFKRNCAPDGIRVFSFELSLRGWWIPSDLGMVKLRG